MPEQAQLTCVSCDTSFEPEPNGGFCPDCDTPHPDYGVEADADDAAAADGGAAEAESVATGDDAPDEADAEAGPSYCPDCGADLDPDARADEAEGDLAACPDCGRAVTDESYCPDCGSDLEAARAEQAQDADEGETDDAADEESADDTTPAEGGADEEATTEDESEADDADEESTDDAADDEPTVTLVVNGERYEFADGDTFGRRDDGWLEDLVAAAGGSDDVAYVSGEHLTFSIEDGDVFVVDVSRNGTDLNGTALDGGKAELEDGDTLTLAERAELEVEL